MRSRSPSTPSEGEIVESDSEKATTSLPSVNGTHVDRHSRIRVSVSKSPEPVDSPPHRYQSRTRSRSPYRESRGEKRRFPDDYQNDRDRSDPRRFKVHYEETLPSSRDRSRVSYADLEKGKSLDLSLRYDDRDTASRYQDKRQKTRSRSPPHPSRRQDHNVRYGREDREGDRSRYGRKDRDSKGYRESSSRLLSNQSVSDRGHNPVAAESSKREAETRHIQSKQSVRISESDQQADKSLEDAGIARSKAGDTHLLSDTRPVDEATLIEERRKRREAIKAKYKGSATPLLVQALQLGNESGPSSPRAETAGTTTARRSESPKASPPSTPKEGSGLELLTAFEVTNDKELANANVNTEQKTAEDEASAADYDPTMDMQEDKMREDRRHQGEELLSSAYNETNLTSQVVLLPVATEEHESKKPRNEFDMFAEEDDDDVFAPQSNGAAGPEKDSTSRAVPLPQPKALDMDMLDNWDDPEGYYIVRLGELIDGRYHVQSNLGRGMFSGVVRAMDSVTRKLVAIKIIRSNDTMKKAGMKEIEILQQLAQADPEDKKHMIRLERYFEHKGHLCMVFENLSINLREVLKKFGRDVGINLRAVRAYAQQMFLGLSLLRKCNVLHADLKPDNVLVNDSRNLLKICDLGSASDASDNEITPYLVSRFYRAPEIILGMPYDFAIDTWSIGCTLFELYTGKILFTGRTNNQMLRSIMECRGKFSHKILRKAQFAGLHFDDLLNFRSVEKDKLTGKDVIRILSFTKPTRDLKTRLVSNTKGMNDVDMKELNLFADLLDRCLNLNPEKRYISDFINGSMVDEKPHKYERADTLPIPTYEEATSSRPSSAQFNTATEEIAHDAERQGLLGQTPRDRESRPDIRYSGYERPTVESARTSLDFLSASDGGSSRVSEEGLRREIIELTLEDPAAVDGRSHISHSLSKRITSFTNTLSSIHLPFRRWAASFAFVRDRIPQPSFRSKGSWVVVGRIFGGFLLMSVVYVLLASNILTMSRSGQMGQTYDPESVRVFVQSHVNGTSIQEDLRRLTAYDHLAGTKGNYIMARWMERLFEAAQIEDVALERFDVYLNYPKAGGRRVAIVEPPEMAWEARIEEEAAYDDPPRPQTLVFHGYSRAGNVTGPLIYANYGSREDFKRLEDSGINMKGAIALVRYYGTQGDRALKVKAAELAGAVGCIIYGDPADDGFGKGEPWPDGRFMPADGVQRGTVGLTSWIVGDVLSPGFPSLPGERKRISKDDNPGLNNIPSIPLAWRDAQRLLQALKGHGQKAPTEWVGAVPDVDWWTGDHTSPVVHLMNEQDEVEKRPIYNVIGKILGLEQPEKSIILGNHRDAWCFGASDPGSGTAVMLEVIRIFGELRKLGWRPLRTIEFALWDGEEYNLIGSTEHVEARIDELRRNGYAYLNVDVAVTGNDFEAAGCPIYERALLRVLGRVTDPVKKQTLRSLWEDRATQLQGLGAGSDYVAFQDIAGISSLDFGFQGPPYPCHSCYDNFEWMTKFGDPGFEYHALMAQIWALLILEMADTPVLPFDMEAYATAVKGYVVDLEKYVEAKSTLLEQNSNLDLRPLHDAADTFADNAAEFHNWDRTWSEIVEADGGLESNVMAIKRMSHNTRMANFETHLLDLDVGGGLPNRTQYKHVIFAPQAWAGYDAAYFPGIRDAVDDGNWMLAREQVEKVAGILGRAARKLNN